MQIAGTWNALSRSSRPKLMTSNAQLADQDLSVLKAVLPELISKHGSGRSQRHLVRAFLDALNHVAGRLPSVAASRALFLDLCPGRSPSMQTFANERRKLQDEQQSIQAATSQLDGAKSGDLTRLVERAVVAGMSKYLPSLENGVQVVQASQIVDFLSSELAHSEQQRRDLANQVASLQGKLQAAALLQEQHQLQQQAWLTQLAELVDANRKMLVEIDGQRRYAMQGIETARAETRLYKERYETAQASHAKRVELMEHFRRAAYQRGAPIPDALVDGVAE